MTDASFFPTLHINQVREDLLKLYRKIAREKGRVEIISDDGNCQCVLISKEELDSLEQAIEILSSEEGVRAMRESMEQLIAQG